jgi:hypothetical protein
LRPDLRKASPPIGPEYGKAVVERTKACLQKLKEEKPQEERGLYFY